MMLRQLPRVHVPQLPRILSSTAHAQSAFTMITARMSSIALHVAPSPEDEQALLRKEIESIQEWWKSPRWKGIKRPYSAREIATKRGTLKQDYPSSKMARKLYSLLEARAKERLPVHTSNASPSPAARERRVLTNL
jgi:isocitrate lyase